MERTQGREPRERSKDAVTKQVLGIINHEISDQSKSDLMVSVVRRRDGQNNTIARRSQVQCRIDTVQEGRAWEAAGE